MGKCVSNLVESVGVAVVAGNGDGVFTAEFVVFALWDAVDGGGDGSSVLERFTPDMFNVKKRKLMQLVTRGFECECQWQTVRQDEWMKDRDEEIERKERELNGMLLLVKERTNENSGISDMISDQCGAVGMRRIAYTWRSFVEIERQNWASLLIFRSLFSLLNEQSQMDQMTSTPVLIRGQEFAVGPRFVNLKYLASGTYGMVV